MGKKIAVKSITVIIIAVIGLVLNYFLLPAWSLRSVGMWLLLLLMAIISAVLFKFSSLIEDDENLIDHISFGIPAVLGCSITVFLVIGCFNSAKMFHATRYQTVAQVENGNFETDFQDISIDYSNLAVVDLDTAIRVGNRAIGNLTHSSWFEVDDEYNLIVYKGKQYRISPLNYGGFFKYCKANNDGIPGYVLVDAQTQEAKFIEVDGGIKYSPSAYWDSYLTRHLRNQYPSYIFGEPFFEIDEEGNCYWITSVKTPTVGVWGCAIEKKFIVTNAQDGSSNEYTIDDLPEWIDHSFDLDYLMDTAFWHYEYVNGYINFSKTGVYRTTYYHEDGNFTGYNSFIDNNGDICFYTGLTPANKAESNVGFLLINTRTGKITQYDCAGAEESSAQSAAEGLVQNLGYTATFPTVVNVCGEETYFMCLKDKAGLIQRYSLCNIENYSIVVEADSIDLAISDYAKKLGKDTSTDNLENVETKRITAKIKAIYTAEIDGMTYMYYQLNDKYLYKSSITVNEKQILLKEGDEITIEYQVTEADIRNVVSIEF